MILKVSKHVYKSIEYVLEFSLFCCFQDLLIPLLHSWLSWASCSLRLSSFILSLSNQLSISSDVVLHSSSHASRITSLSFINNLRWYGNEHINGGYFVQQSSPSFCWELIAVDLDSHPLNTTKTGNRRRLHGSLCK